jgi:glycine/D-amino acid oxidase-like deaminating enzyme
MTDARSIFAPNFVTYPYWWEAAPPEEAKSETLPESVEVAIIGSGYCGLAAALELSRSGTRAAVLEAGPLGFGASTRSGGMVSSGQKLVLTGAIETFGPALAERVFAESKASYALVQDLVAREELDADLQRCGRFFAAWTPRDYPRLAANAEKLQRYTQVDVRLVPRERQREEIGSDYFHGGFVVADYGGVHPAKYNKALRDAARRAGATLHSHAAARAIRREGERFVIDTPRGRVLAKEVIVATNGYTDSTIPYLQHRIVPVRSYIVATEELPEATMREITPHRRMMSDSRRELSYFRPSPDGRRLLMGCRPTALDRDERRAAIGAHRRIVNIFPQLAGVQLTHAWSGFVGMTFDHVPHMGTHEGVHYAMGCNGNGVAIATYLGHRTARKILGRDNQPSVFDNRPFPAKPYYSGFPWMVPLASAWYHLCDAATRPRSIFGG